MSRADNRFRTFEPYAGVYRGSEGAGGRAIPLKVKGGFHSPFMKEASEAFAKLLETVSFSKGNIDVYSNLTAQPYTDDIKSLLSEQICHPVRWEKTIRNMIGSGSWILSLRSVPVKRLRI